MKHDLSMKIKKQILLMITIMYGDDDADDDRIRYT
jgi:hypothetical protein